MNMKKLMVAAAFSVAFICSGSVLNAVASDTEAPAGLAGIAGKASGLTDLVNLNTASTDALAAVPGIGPQIAEAITSYRDANGPFSKITDLVNVEGIDMNLVKKIAPLLSL